MVGRISSSGNDGQRHMKLSEELDQARVSPPGAPGFGNSCPKDSTSLSLIHNLQNGDDSMHLTEWFEEK